MIVALGAGGCVDAGPHASSDSAAAPIDVSDADVTVLDRRGDATILGRVEPVLPSSDADRVLVLGSEGAGPVGAAIDGVRALDARFVDEGVVVLGADRVLRVHGSDGSVAPLADEVLGPLSVAGDVVAYVRGAPPDLELGRADVRTGAVEQLTHGMAPVWSPALSSDGSKVLFASGRAGSPRLFRLDRGGAITALAPTARIPSAPTPPRWRGETLVFEDERGIALLDLERETIVAELPDAHELTARADGTLAARIDGRVTRIELPGGAR